MTSRRPEIKQELAAEAKRRLRLSRIVSGITSTTASIQPASDDDEFDVIIRLSSPGPDLAEQVRALFADMRVQVHEGQWKRS